MGGILSSFSKIDSIINPESERNVENNTNITSTENDKSIQNINNTDKIENNTEIKESKETIIVDEKLTDKSNDLSGSETKEKLEEKHKEEPVKDGKMIEVIPVNLTDTTDVIKKHSRKRKYHQA